MEASCRESGTRTIETLTLPVATVALGATIGLPIAAVAAVPAALLGWRWWKHRAENGIKF